MQLSLERAEVSNQRLRDFCRAHNLQPPVEIDDDGSWPRRRKVQLIKDGLAEAPGKLPAFRKDSLGENYIGSATMQSLTVPQGSCITVFDNKLDFNDFLRDDSPAYTLSDAEYNNYSTGRVAVEPPKFPPRQDVESSAYLFFTIIAPFTPILHRPDFYKLVHRIYEGPALSNAEKVIVHMVLSIVGFQVAIRTFDHQLGELAKQQFIYSLTFTQELTEDVNLERLQALALLCVAMRSLQRPGPAWKLCGRVFALCIELGLHRSAEVWEKQSGNSDEHELHMNQRIFWTLLVINVNMNAKFGRPMPILEQYIDVEIPEPKLDNLPGQADYCSWYAAPYGFKLTRIMLQVHTQLNALRQTTSDREIILLKLMSALDDFDRTLPPQLKTVEQNPRNEDIVAGRYLQVALLSTRMLLRHPAHLASPKGFETSRENLDQCLILARKIRDNAVVLKDMKALDTTIYYNMDFLCAIFLTIFVFERRHHAARIKQAPVKHIYLELEKEATRWRPILEEVGYNLGSEMRLANTISGMFERCIARMKSSMDEPLPIEQTRYGHRTNPSEATPCDHAADHRMRDQRALHMHQRPYIVTGCSDTFSPGSIALNSLTSSAIATPGSEVTMMNSPGDIQGQDGIAACPQMVRHNVATMYDHSTQSTMDLAENNVAYNYAGPVVTGQGAQMFHDFGEQAFQPGWTVAQQYPISPDGMLNQQRTTYFLQQFPPGR